MSAYKTPMIGVCPRCAELFDECRCEEGERRRRRWMAGDTGENDPGKAFLNRFENRRKSFVAPQFYTAVRSGITDAETVCKAVERSMERRLRDAHSQDEREKVTLLLDALRMFPDEALLFAVYVTRQEGLPASVRAQQKASRSAKYRKEYYRQQGWTR